MTKKYRPSIKQMGQEEMSSKDTFKVHDDKQNTSIITGPTYWAMFRGKSQPSILSKWKKRNSTTVITPRVKFGQSSFHSPLYINGPPSSSFSPHLSRSLITSSSVERVSLSRKMASVTASHFVSLVNNNHGGASGSEANANLSQINFKCQSTTHCGLRSFNMVDRLQRRCQAKAVSAKSSKGLQQNAPKAKRVGKIVCEKGMSMIFIGAEVGPWSKTGGLGDVLGGLPPALAARGHRVMTVCPRYDQYKDAWDTCVVVQIKVGDKVEEVRFFHCYKRGVDRVFVDHPLFLAKVVGKTGSKIYGPITGVDYTDNQLRFSLLCQAALEAPRVLNLNSSKYFSGPYGEDVVFVANDWHTALLPCYLKSMYQSRGIYMNAKVVFCIHNIAYQGRFAFDDFSLLNLPDSFKSSFDFMDGYEKPLKGRKINWMKAAILEAWRVLTVSPYYAQELISGIDRGVELHSYLRMKTVSGIINGMDGTGKKKMEAQILELEEKFPGKAVGVAKFNVPLAHMITAGADFIIVPSRFEPCGLIQLHAMRYGTVPIVASTGGLVDTVKDGYTGFHIGRFNVKCEVVDPDDVIATAKAVARAVAVYGTPAMKEMVKNCMDQDFSWKGPARLWEKVLLSLDVAGSEAGVEGEEIAPLAKENVATP
ncbi:hypothetical protein HID58_067028 [Brassica napus]|uniref:Starch synthase, chloroplastic/amyloplastic n=1 Tax=Brassica napus TaxID=3708 RepID=A0ABQ7ZHE8_BRANA|nr:hypothetical protein HID58_067028 [Brassica napus]